MTPVAVVGLGAMGLGMAATLAGKGFAVTGFDLSGERRALAAEAGVRPAASLGEAITAGGVLVLSLPLAAHVEAVVEGADGVLARARPGAVVVDTSTSEAAVSRRLAALCAGSGFGFLDAPVSGGPAGAKSGALTFMIGGDADHLARARPAIEAMAGKVLHVGPSGAGNVAKLVNNLLVAAHLLTVSEAMRLAEAAGVPAADALAVVNAASGRSAVSEVNYPRWILPGTFDSGFTMGLMRKDVRLAAGLGTETGALGPVSRLVAELWAASAERLPDGEDFNRIVEIER
jgi:3-hydroxyisobutyrate dehydrogenase